MKGAFAILAASLCIVAASAIVAPVQQGAVDVNGGPDVEVPGRQLLHKDDDYNYDWHKYSHYDNVVYKAAKWAIKVFGKNDYLLRTVFGSSYEHGYTPKYINLVKAYYYEDKYHNKYFLLTIYFEYNHHYYTYDFVVFAKYYRNYYDFKYLYKIIYNNRYLTGKYW